jgi:opacity protein-like surface antigen
MKNLLLTTTIFLVTGNIVTFSQSDFYNDVTIEAGVSSGIMNCLTDLGGRAGTGKSFFKDINWKQGKVNWGVFTEILYQSTLGARLEFTVGNVAADDNVLAGDQSAAQTRYRRNLQFRSKIKEVSLTMELHPLALLAQSMDNELPMFSPYILAGIGVYKFNPEAQLNGKWVALRPLHTEGQGFAEYPDRRNYKLTQVNLPVGLGVKYDISSLLNARIEFVYRILLTDYLDDVSQRYVEPALFYKYLDPSTAPIAEQLADRRRPPPTDPNNAPLPYGPGQKRGNPDSKDAFFSINLKLGFVLNRGSE